MDIETTPDFLQSLSVGKLAHYCSDISSVLDVRNDDDADIYCIWGEFTVQRQLIRGGVRFTLPECPNALAWTITTGLAPEPDKVVIHCTINRPTHDPDFIESIESFIDAWKTGLETEGSPRIEQ